MANHDQSNEYLHRCVEVIKADKNISQDTLTWMFVEFRKIVLQEAVESRNQKNASLKKNWYDSK